MRKWSVGLIIADYNAQSGGCQHLVAFLLLALVDDNGGSVSLLNLRSERHSHLLRRSHAEPPVVIP